MFLGDKGLEQLQDEELVRSRSTDGNREKKSSSIHLDKFNNQSALLEGKHTTKCKERCTQR